MSIPKRIFFFWGNKTLSWMRYLTLKSFRLLNPDWQMILYTSKCTKDTKTWNDDVAQDFHTYKGRDYLPQVEELGVEIHEWHLQDYENITASHLSNFLKWHKLSAHGGVYSDMDILWAQPMDKLYDEFRDFDVAICVTRYLSIGLLGSSIGNRMFTAFFNNAKVNYDPTRYQCVGVENIYDLLYNAEAFNKDGKVDWNFIRMQNIMQDLRDMFPELKIFNIPFGCVYPFTCTNTEGIFKAKHDLPNHVVGLHWYAGAPLAQQWNSILDEQSVLEHDNTFTRIASRYG